MKVSTIAGQDVRQLFDENGPGDGEQAELADIFIGHGLNV
jgi:hypothetical protein